MVKKPLLLLAKNIPAGGSRRFRPCEGSPMRRDLSRLLRPRSIAVIGGGAWCANVVEQCRKMGFDGAIWPVHPTRAALAGVPAFARIEDVPGVPDAAFIGVNRHATVDIVGYLAGIGAGGAVCFASGFREAQAETGDGAGLQDQLLQAAGEMPILGPNCYGLINYLDGALLWPDQHGGQRCDRGVAIVTQSSNIAINLTMQARGLPIAYVMTGSARLDCMSRGSVICAPSRRWPQRRGQGASRLSRSRPADRIMQGRRRCRIPRRWRAAMRGGGRFWTVLASPGWRACPRSWRRSSWCISRGRCARTGSRRCPVRAARRALWPIAPRGATSSCRH